MDLVTAPRGGMAKAANEVRSRSDSLPLDVMGGCDDGSGHGASSKLSSSKARTHSLPFRSGRRTGYVQRTW